MTILLHNTLDFPHGPGLVPVSGSILSLVLAHLGLVHSDSAFSLFPAADGGDSRRIKKFSSRNMKRLLNIQESFFTSFKTNPFAGAVGPAAFLSLYRCKPLYRLPSYWTVNLILPCTFSPLSI